MLGASFACAKHFGAPKRQAASLISESNEDAGKGFAEVR